MHIQHLQDRIYKSKVLFTFLALALYCVFFIWFCLFLRLSESLFFMALDCPQS